MKNNEKTETNEFNSVCPFCGAHEITDTGDYSQITEPPVYSYRCDNCKHDFEVVVKQFWHKFPTVDDSENDNATDNTKPKYLVKRDMETSEEEFEYSVGRCPTKNEMKMWVHYIETGIDAQLDWSILNNCAAEYFKTKEAKK